MHLLGYMKSTLLVRNLQDVGFKSNLKMNHLYFLMICMFNAWFYYVCTSWKSKCESVLCIYLLMIVSYLVNTLSIFFRKDMQSICNMKTRKEKKK